MAGTKVIRDKIKSVQNTRKITKAMEMVAASKMRRAQERMRAARPYADTVRRIVAHLSRANPEYQHPFSVPNPDAKNIGVILVTTDKGLCGGLNTTIFRTLLAKFPALKSLEPTVETTAIGNKGVGFLGRLGAPVVSQVVQLGDTPQLEPLIGAVKIQFDAYTQRRLGAVYLAYTRFINTMKQEPIIEQLLPLTDQFLPEQDALLSVESKVSQDEPQDAPAHYAWDYIYEPEPQSVIDELLLRYIEARVYQAVAENMASEQSARMVAMKSASDNAKTIIDDLRLVYNKSRQAAITKELAEIVGGAAAV
jgi:F-type H+-transporting ATPase subunit gamma